MIEGEMATDMSDTENFDVFKHKNLLEKKNSGLIFFSLMLRFISFYLYVFCLHVLCVCLVPVVVRR